ncbi:MAG TPA: putative baseplate assembly protein [Bryobacteraceae bacterium]|nr:putative baseplate assembly protein [Bryobacteraceae bacterium]
MSAGDSSNLNSCGCCEGLPPLATEQNDPGLSAIAYRLATYATFLRRMLSQIQSPNSLAAPPDIPWVLSALATRSSDDPAVALMDAWAVVADVLTFYQERIVNEGFLRTATERQSVLELARAIGYELSPGVAASAYLAFTAEDVVGAGVVAPLPQSPKVPSVPTQGANTFNLGSATVPAGSKVQSIPAPGKLPQTFETSADAAVRTQWNMLLPRLTRPADLAIGADGQLYLLGVRADFPAGFTVLSPSDAYLLNPDTPPLSGPAHALPVSRIYLAGIATNIKTGDRVLLAGSNNAGQTQAVTFTVRNAVALASQNQTRVDFADNPPTVPFSPATFPAGTVPSQPVIFNQANLQQYVLGVSIEESDLQSIIHLSNWDPAQLSALANFSSAAPFSFEGIFAFQAEAAFFGNNAPLWKTLTNPNSNNKVLRGDPFPEDWDAANNGAGRLIWTDSQGNFHQGANVFLERALPQLVKNTWALFESPGLPPTPYRVVQVVERSLADYGISGRSSGLSLETPQGAAVVGLGTPSAVSGGLHPLDVFAIGSDGSAYFQWGNSGAWQAQPQDLSGPGLLNTPSAVAGGPSALEVFAVAADGNLYHDWWNGGWSGWWSLGGGSLAGSPSAVVWASNAIDVFAIGSDGTLYHWWFNGAWNGPESLGGANLGGGARLVNSPAAVAGGPSAVETFAIGSDGMLYHVWWNNGWFGPERLGGGNLAGSPSVVANGPNPLDVFAIGSDGVLYHFWFNNGWNGPEFLGGRNLVNSPSATRNGPNPLDVFALGADGNLYHVWWNGAWFGPENLGGGQLTGSPSALANGAHPLDIFAAGEDGNLYHRWFDASGWHGFENLQGGDIRPFPVRTTAAFVQSQQQTFAEYPVTDDIPAGSQALMLNGMVPGLTPGQAVALTGTRSDAPGVTVSEILLLQDIVHDGGFTTLEFTEGLEFGYQRQTVTLTANVAAATEGGTIAVPEVMGSGDASQVNQSFVLKSSPLTYVSAATPSGAASTLEVRVNDLLWTEAPSLYGLGPDDQQYITRRSDDGTTTVIFGDGVTGARLPTGQNNIAATYRTGIGTDGNVAAGSLSILQTRPAGIRGVTNPLQASGGADPEDLDHARSNAPLTVLTLDRIVSLEDYEDFAAAFAGIGKAQAIPLWDGETGLVHLTVAGIEGAPVDPTSQLYLSLTAAIDAARDPVQQVRVASYLPVLFHLAAAVIIDVPRYVAADVLAAVESALAAAFSFDQRAFAQPVAAAEVIAAIQAVPGVIATFLEKLYRDDDPSGPGQTVPDAVLPAAYAYRQNGTIVPAELLLLNPVGFSVTEKLT